MQGDVKHTQATSSPEMKKYVKLVGNQFALGVVGLIKKAAISLTQTQTRIK